MNKGYAVILTGYIGWGLFPLYWALLIHVPPGEVLLHRMLWSVPVLVLLVVLSQRRRDQFRASAPILARTEMANPVEPGDLPELGHLHLGGCQPAVVEASMGYFLTPLLNVLAGVIVFEENWTRLRLVAIACAAAASAYYVLTTATFPWVGLAVAYQLRCLRSTAQANETNAVPGCSSKPCYCYHLRWR